jgi:hypothetical protein
VEIDKQIDANKLEYEFLHKILIESGNNLVTFVIQYLKWLGFNDVIEKDSSAEGGLLEEDIQVDLGEKGLLIIEVKGIGGTSKDAECSQIHKVKYRRSKERKRFDVYALYIVNNERNLPPLNRTIPPFNQTQIIDAKNDERGLLYTWQLFNLYFNIESGFITKEIARERILHYGLIDFTPELLTLGMPYKFFKNNTVICVELNNTEIKKGGFLVFEGNGRYYKSEIINIEIDGHSKESANIGKVGIELSEKIPKINIAYYKD